MTNTALVYMFVEYNSIHYEFTIGLLDPWIAEVKK